MKYKTKLSKILTKNFLIKEYIKNRKSSVQIAKEVNCGSVTICNYLNKHNIKIRTMREIQKNNAHSLKDGRSLKKYYCIDCGEKICVGTGLYGKGRCHKCKYKNPKNHPRYKDGCSLKKYYCIDCKKEINYRSKRCKHCASWKGGKSFDPYPLGWTKIFKEQIRNRDGYKCQLCGCPEVECNTNLSVHHIDYDKNNLSLDNLISLCHLCHLKTNGNRKYWEKYFQKMKIEFSVLLRVK